MTASTVAVPGQRPTRKPSQILCTTTYKCSRTPEADLFLGDELTLISRSQSYGEPTVSIAANVLNQLCYENRDALMAGIIVAGWDKDVGPSVYNIPLGGGVFRQPWAIGGMSRVLWFEALVAQKCTYRIWLDIRVRLLRRYIPGWLGP